MKFSSPARLILLVAIGLAPMVQAQTAAPAAVAPAAAPQAATPGFKQEELDSLLAPIALYPDALLSQLLMASTYPLEVVEAARWRKANASLTGTALDDAVQKQAWDESVKSLAAFPDVLSRMNEDLAWTQKLGDAFLGQQAQVMDTIQSLRQKAQTAGNLKSNEQQKVEVQQQDNKQYIVIQPANPQIVYVPVYQPTVVYGPWWYPAYPPYYPSYWAPPGAAFVSGMFWGVGIAAGAAMWGGWNWHSHNVNINVNHYNSYNRTNISNSNWNHNVNHRGAVPYRDAGSRDKYAKVDRQAAQSREQFRGRDDTLGGKGLNDKAGLSDAAKKGPGSLADRGGAAKPGTLGDRAGASGDRTGSLGGAGDRAGTRDLPDRAGASPASRELPGGVNQRVGAAPANRSPSGAFGGGDGGQTRAAADRGRSSMGSAPARAAPARSGGGGARGGGGGHGRR